MSQFRPLLGAVVTDLNQVKYPVFASTKLDGIRAIWHGKEFLSRTLKTIPNRALQQVFSKLKIPSGWDGELIWGEPNAPNVYRQTNSNCMTIAGSAENLRFFTFDSCEVNDVFAKRIENLWDIEARVIRLDQVLLDDSAQLFDFEQKSLAAGYEGVVLRAPEGRYKYGRSTLREQYLLKLKRFTDAEATVIGFEELKHNANEAGSDERGYTKRSSHQENKIPMGVMGSLLVVMGSTEFNIGTGFTTEDRRTIWRNRDKYLGKLAKFKYLNIGVKDAPRHPVFLGWRSVIDT